MMIFDDVGTHSWDRPAWLLVCSCKQESRRRWSHGVNRITSVGEWVSEYVWHNVSRFKLGFSWRTAPLRRRWACERADQELMGASLELAATLLPHNNNNNTTGRCKTGVGGRQGLFCNLSSGGRREEKAILRCRRLRRFLCHQCNRRFFLTLSLSLPLACLLACNQGGSFEVWKMGFELHNEA